MLGIVRIFMVLSWVIGWWSCTTRDVDDLYYRDIEEWRSTRLASLTAPQGWTTLIGLYWLEPGNHTFGADSSNPIIFPSGPSHLGTLHVDSVVRVRIHPDHQVYSDGQVVDSMVMVDDLSGKPTLLNWEHYFWLIIKRGDKFALRLRDTLAPARSSLHELAHFPVDKKWQVEAQFIPADSGQTLPITNILGQTEATASPGHLVFKLEGKKFRLAALEGNDHEYFIIIADQTTGVETYGGGRYLYIPKADEHGRTVIDFNKAYNPPCVFSPYATCPLPPKENHLPITLLAGEKNLPGH